MPKTSRSNERIKLPNGCECTPPYIVPENWRDRSGRITGPWFLRFTFYDPARCPQGKKINWEGMNGLKTWPARRDAAAELLESTVENLRNGFNPVTRQFVAATPAEQPGANLGVIGPKTTLPDALAWASDKASWGHKTRADIRGYMSAILPAIGLLRYDGLELAQVTAQHIDAILEKAFTLTARRDPKTKRDYKITWSNYKRNRAKAYLSAHFAVLKKKRVLLVNPCAGLEKLPWKTAEPVGFTQEQREAIDAHLWQQDPRFANFINIFFHSAARETELLKVRAEDVDIERNRVTITLLKGGQNERAPVTIKDIALPYWVRALQGIKPGQYVFGRPGFAPSDRPIGCDIINKRWRKLVVGQLGIKVRPYELKHTNLTDIVDMFGSEAAAASANHTTEAMVKKVYDIRKKQRSHETIKGASNHFGAAPTTREPERCAPCAFGITRSPR